MASDSPLGQYSRAIASLIITTPGAEASSCPVKLRPCKMRFVLAIPVRGRAQCLDIAHWWLAKETPVLAIELAQAFVADLERCTCRIIRKVVEESLKRLRTDRIDLYY